MSETVRCKFKVIEITKREYGSSAKFDPVVSGSQENEEFFGATPWGQLEIGVSNESLDNLKPGDEYYIDITKA
jgi:hypothetical protein